MQYDFSRVDDTLSYVFIPEGRYLCRVADVREGTSRDGSQRWSFRLEVRDGEFAGRTAGWDSITWSERGIHRVKLVLAAFGFDVSGELEIGSHELLGREVGASFLLEEREEPTTGVRQSRLVVPYVGYEPVHAVAGDASSGNHAPRVDSPRSG